MASQLIDGDRKVISDSFTTTSTPVLSAGDDDNDVTDGGINLEKDREAQNPGTTSSSVENGSGDATEYPQGFGLAIIVLALMLSIFLASLDMVGRKTPWRPDCRLARSMG